MHCAICDKQLSDKEFQFDSRDGKIEPCSTCLEIIYDTAYQGRFRKENADEFGDDGSIDILDDDYDPDYSHEIRSYCGRGYEYDEEDYN